MNMITLKQGGSMELGIEENAWPLAKTFRISRGAIDVVPTLTISISDGGLVGRGEAAGVDYAGETIESMIAQVNSVRNAIQGGADRSDLQVLLPPGGARNALDCALWDLEAKRSGKRAWETAGRPMNSVQTVYTVGIDSLEHMMADAAAHAHFPVLKVKLDKQDPLAKLRVLAGAAPASSFIVDPNQSWTRSMVDELLPELIAHRVVLLEQPLPAGEDHALDGYAGGIPICADESCNTVEDLPKLAGRYSMLNVKLDKTGGLTAALALVDAAIEAGFALMVGNMNGSSLAMAPAMLIAQYCLFVDLDGPLLLRCDRDTPMLYDGASVQPPPAALWG